MLGHSDPTPYDLNFRLFGTPVRVHPFFWVVMFVLGYQPSDGGMQDNTKVALVWTVAAFISILVHEFGHVLSARAFHWRTDEVVLYYCGGYAALHPPRGHRLVINDILISLAGPCAGFLLYGIIWLGIEFAPHMLGEMGDLGLYFWSFMLYINLYWGLFNLLPIYPLDGGQVVRTFLTATFRGGSTAATFISCLTAAGMALYMFQSGNRFMGMMMIMLLIQNVQMLQRY